jgi:hypothetical protein
MPKFTITRMKNSRWYDTDLFNISTTPGKKSGNILATFHNDSMAVCVFISRSEAADVLKRKFKNNVDRRAQRA